jgi:hypothetical protein
MRGRPGLFDIDDQLKRLIDLGDPVETFRVDFDLFPAGSLRINYRARCRMMKVTWGTDPHPHL